MPIKEHRFTVYEYAEFEDHLPETFYTPIYPSNAENLLNNLKSVIEQKNATTLKKNLTDFFVYPGDGRTSRENIENIFNILPSADPYHFTYRGGHHTRTIQYQFYLARPVIEALFFEYNALFRKLVTLIAQSDDSAMHQAFVSSFHNTDIPLDILQGWDTNAHNAITHGITVIENYGKRLCEKNVSKGQHAAALACNLNESLQALPINDNTDTSKVKWLDFKFNFIRTLHSKDQYFVGHRGWKRVIGNIASIIFSACILNLIKLGVTGNFLFFNQTKTQALVEKLEHSVQARRSIIAQF